MQGDKIVDKISMVDLSELEWPMIAIYQYPEDYPEKCVARVFDKDKPTNVIMLADCVWILRFDIEKSMQMYFCPAGSGDVRSLVGVYV